MGGGIGSILYSDRGATREHFTYNAVGHTVALTRPNGSVAKSDLYEAFGNIVASTGSSSNNRLANTKERSFTLGLDNHGFRYFDPEIGRYISRDPIGYGDGLNVYLYVHNNPINHVDPDGLLVGIGIDVGLMLWDSYLYANNRISPEEYRLRLAISSVALLTDIATGGSGTGSAMAFAGRAGMRVAAKQLVKEGVAGAAANVGAHAILEANRAAKELPTMMAASTKGPAENPESKNENNSSTSDASFESSPQELKAEITAPKPAAKTPWAARREAMRDAGIPTSQQPVSQKSVKSPDGTPAGRQYTYETPSPGGGSQVQSVQHSLTDQVQGHGPHWEAGPVKPGGQTDSLGRPRLTNDKVKVNE